MRRANGFTITEITVCMGITVILAALTYGYMHQSNRLSTQVSHTQEVFSRKIRLLQTILEDLRAAKRTSIGSLLINGDFEWKQNDTTPYYWSSSVTGAGSYSYLKSSSDDEVHGGFRSVSLKSTNGSLVTYDSTLFLTLQNGCAYMVSAYVRTENAATSAKLSIIDSGETELGSAATNSTAWTHLKFRFPATGTYLDQVNSNQAKVRLSVQTSTHSVYFDDVAFTHIKAVLASNSSDDVNIVSDGATQSLTDASGFRFERWDGQTAHMYRYRIGTNQDEKFLLRERYDTTTAAWEADRSIQYANGISLLSFSYDDNLALPAAGKEGPIKMSLGMQTRRERMNNHKLLVESVNVLPVSP